MFKSRVRSFLTSLWISVTYYRNNGLGGCGSFLLMGGAGVSTAKFFETKILTNEATYAEDFGLFSV